MKTSCKNFQALYLTIPKYIITIHHVLLNPHLEEIINTSHTNIPNDCAAVIISNSLLRIIRNCQQCSFTTEVAPLGLNLSKNNFQTKGKGTPGQLLTNLRM